MSRSIEVTFRSEPPPDVRAVLDATLRAHATLQDVLDWCKAQAPRRDLANVVVQDEFTHDVVLEVAEGLHAVYDTT